MIPLILYSKTETDHIRQLLLLSIQYVCILQHSLIPSLSHTVSDVTYWLQRWSFMVQWVGEIVGPPLKYNIMGIPIKECYWITHTKKMLTRNVDTENSCASVRMPLPMKHCIHCQELKTIQFKSNYTHYNHQWTQRWLWALRKGRSTTLPCGCFSYVWNTYLWMNYTALCIHSTAATKSCCTIYASTAEIKRCYQFLQIIHKQSKWHLAH